MLWDAMGSYGMLWDAVGCSSIPGAGIGPETWRRRKGEEGWRNPGIQAATGAGIDRDAGRDPEGIQAGKWAGSRQGSGLGDEQGSRQGCTQGSRQGSRLGYEQGSGGRSWVCAPAPSVPSAWSWDWGWDRSWDRGCSSCPGSRPGAAVPGIPSRLSPAQMPGGHSGRTSQALFPAPSQPGKGPGTQTPLCSTPGIPGCSSGNGTGTAGNIPGMRGSSPRPGVRGRKTPLSQISREGTGREGRGGAALPGPGSGKGKAALQRFGRFPK